MLTSIKNCRFPIFQDWGIDTLSLIRPFPLLCQLDMLAGGSLASPHGGLHCRPLLQCSAVQCSAACIIAAQEPMMKCRNKMRIT